MIAYKEIAYLESTGTQWIDTLWSPQSNNLRVKFKVKSKGTPRSTAICGAENSSIVPRWVFVMFGQAADSTKTFPLIGDWKNGGTGFSAEGFTFTDGTILDIDWTTSSTSTTITDSISNTTYTHTFDTTITYSNNTTTLKLFQNGDAQKSSIDMYYYQIYDNNILVRDFIPVLDFNNIPAMYDKVNNVLYYNQGTGQFKYSIKPYKCEVEYLESTGTGTYTSGQYIDTGLDYFADFEITAKQRESAGMKALGTLTTYCVERENATTNAWRFRNGESTFFTTSLLVTDLHTLKWKNGKVYGDSVELGSFAKTSNTGRMYLFGAATPNDATRINRYPLQIYACKLWNPTTGELVRDFIPVLDNNDVPCMYDKVSKQFFYNQGTGSFIAGRQIKEVEYIESTGTQYIDTGYIPTANTSFDLYGINMDYHAGTTRFGSRVNEKTENYCFTVINGDLFRFSYGTGQSTGTLQYIFNTQKLAKQVSYDASTKICTITFTDDTTEQSTAFTAIPLTSSAKSLYLFAFNNNGSAVSGISKQTGLKIYEGTELVRDYIPAIDENGIAFMFDRVTHAIYDNAGTGEFLYGPQVVEKGNPSLSLRRKLMMLLARGKKKYTPLKYLESTGTQYIDTGITGDENTKWVVTAAILGSQDTRVYMGQTYNDAQNPVNNRFAFGYNEDGWYCGMGDKNVSRIAASNTNSHVFVLDAPNKKFYVDNNSYDIGWTTFSQPSAVVLGLCLFGRGCADTGEIIPYINARIFSTQIYKNNVLVMDLKPILDKNGTPCMWDTVTNKLFYNEGTGDFTYEEWDFTPCDYIYADGNAYTSTLWHGTSDTKMEMVFDIAEQSTQNRGSMGSRISANSQLLAIGYGVSALASDFNNSSYSTYRAFIDYNTNTKYRVYTSKEKRSIIDEATGTVLAENNTLCTDNMSTGVLLLGAETGLSYRHVGKIYGAKIWEGDTLIRDYIPVVDGDNKGCFYDKTLNALFYSSGSSDFVGHFEENGVDYKVVKNIIAEQVASATSINACPYINTGLYPSTNAKTRLKCKASLAVATTSYEHYLGGTNASTRFVLGQAGGSSGSKFYFGLGTRNYWTTKNVDTDTHIFGLDWATETCSIDDTTWQIPDAGTSEASKPFFINARNTANYANANRPGGGTSYWWKFWEGKKLVYNGIPVVRTSDNKVGLFETVNREFQTTAGTVEYTYTE